MLTSHEYLTLPHISVCVDGSRSLQFAVDDDGDGDATVHLSVRHFLSAA